jgi:HPt (histidine-containing phosphotransfer) domain-containing protein
MTPGEKQNITNVTDHAHRMASLPGLIGAQELNQAARGLQTADRSLSTEQRSTLIVSLAQHFAALAQRLNEAG